MEFSRQEHWSGLPFPTPGDLPDPWIEPSSLVSPALAGGFFTTSAPWEAHVCTQMYININAYMSVYTYVCVHTHTYISPRMYVYVL